MVTRECSICGTNFEAKKHNHVMCSKECRMEHDRRRRRKPLEEHKHWNKTCVICNLEFETKHPFQKTCSKECSKRNNSKWHSDKYPTLVKDCVTCQKSFTTKLTRKINCSKECSRLYKNKWNRKRGKTKRVKEMKRQWRNKNRTKINQRNMEIYYENMKDKNYVNKRRKQIREYARYRNATDVMWKINNRMRSNLKYNLLHNSISKTSTTFKLLGYSVVELKEHIESQFTDGMSWDNIGEWHIDHIRPLSSFDYDSTDHPDFKKMLGVK